MSEFKVGDKVKVLTRSERQGNVATVVAQRDGGVGREYYDVTGDGIPQVSSVTPGAGTYSANSLSLIERPTTFKVGDRVKTKSIGGRRTLHGVVDRKGGAGFDWFVKITEGSTGLVEVVRMEEDLELMQSEPTPTGITLRAGDKIRNRITGREGYVYPAPIARVLKVYDARPPYRDGVPAAAVEEYEFHHPGTYELVLRGQGEVF